VVDLGLSEIGVRRLIRIRAAIEIIAFHQAFYPLLDHVDVGLEAVGELLDHFCDELLMGEMLSLSNSFGESVSIRSQNSSLEKYPLHDSDNCGVNGQTSLFVCLSLRHPSLVCVFRSAASVADDANLDVKVGAREALVEVELVSRFDLLAHGLFPQNSGLRNHGE
jgi:hypothetical protein